MGSRDSTNGDERKTNQPSTLAALGLDRKAMEQERLARAASRKRERSISPPRISRKAPKVEETTVELPSGARLNMFSSLVQQGQQERKPDAANTSIANMSSKPSGDKVKDEPKVTTDIKPESMPSGAIKYPNGVVKKTWAFGHPRTGSDIKLEEVLEPQTLKQAMLSAFQWDVEWVLSKLKIPPHGGKTKCIFVMQAKDEKDRELWRKQSEYMSSFLRLCFPNMSGMINCMHSKLMLLSHPHKLRIAIPTANLLNFDWGETGQMENSVFMIDLPRLPDGQRLQINDLPRFGQELMYFLEQLGLDDDIRAGVLNFDFSATKDMVFVHTVGGVHWRDGAGRTGLMGLSKAVNDLSLATEDLEIDFAASSIGRLNDSYLRDFHSAAKGIDLIAQAAEAKSSAAATFFQPKRTSSSASPISSSVREKLRIYFPTASTVRASIAGAAGTLCIARNYFEGSTFPRSCFRDYVSTREGLLSHNKILLARGKNKVKQDVAWVYVGSSNMSKSAWGDLPKDRKAKKISCMNWECGVILPVVRATVEAKEEVEMEDGFNMVKKDDSETESEDEEPAIKKAKAKAKKAKKIEAEGEDSETESEGDDPVMFEAPPSSSTASTTRTGLVDFDVFKTVLDVPFKTPGEKYRDGQEPWYFKEQ